MRTFLISMFLLCASLNAQPPPKPTATVTLSWDSVTDPRVQEIRIYYGAATHLYDGFFSVAPTATEATVNGLEQSEDYFFAAATHSDAMGDGQLSREVKYHTPGSPKPNQPSPITLQIENENQISPNTPVGVAAELRR